MSKPILVVTVGLPGVGKTTRAKELEAELDAVRFTPDEWLRPLHGLPNENHHRDTIEGRFVAVARRLLTIGTNVVLDFGCWSKHEREGLHDLAASAGADFRIESLTLDRDEQWRRVEARTRSAPETTYPITQDDLAEYERMFEAPTDEEVAATKPPPPPPEAGEWTHWRAARWPTSEDP